LDNGDMDRRETPAPAILYRNDQLIVLDKPAGLLTDEIVAEMQVGLEAVAGTGEPVGDGLLRAVYSVDDGASGLLLVATSPEAAAQLERQLDEKVLEVKWLALVRARPGQTSGTINRPLLDNSAGGGVVRVDEHQGHPAVTEWRLLDSYIGFALLECIPRTRIARQIRAHLQAEGMPLVVDPRYGGGEGLLLSSFKAGYRPSRRREERPLIRRLTLHAQSLTFAHPITGEQMHFESPPPKDLKAALHQLDRFGRMAP
jgi:23S rRNA-/tRNA-specific pseudouridylate synthase